MLILSRRCGERIICGKDGDFIITINDICGNSAKIGIDAPKNIPIFREEIYNRIQQEKKDGNK
jgi:carbon storage regulator